MGRARLTTSIGWTKAAGQPSTTSLALVYLRPPRWPIWLVGVVAAFGAVEAATRRDMRNYLYDVTIALAILNAAILLYQFWLLALVLVLVGLVILMICDNLREVFGG
jgi:hypothetical protein